MEQYINNQQTQSYGDRFARNLRRIFEGDSPKPILVIMAWCADQMTAVTASMRGAMATQRSASSERSAAAEEKLPAVVTARAELKAFSLLLAARKADTHEPWNGDLELFLPGGISAVKTGALAVRDAVAVAHAALAKDDGAPERAKWLKRLEAQVQTLNPLVGRADDAGAAHFAVLSEQSAEKRSWLRTYRGAVLVLHGLLVMTGRESEYTAAVPHLSARKPRRKTSAVPAAPVTPA